MEFVIKIFVGIILILQSISVNAQAASNGVTYTNGGLIALPYSSTPAISLTTGAFQQFYSFVVPANNALILNVTYGLPAVLGLTDTPRAGIMFNLSVDFDVSNMQWAAPFSAAGTQIITIPSCYISNMNQGGQTAYLGFVGPGMFSAITLTTGPAIACPANTVLNSGTTVTLAAGQYAYYTLPFNFTKAMNFTMTFDTTNTVLYIASNVWPGNSAKYIGLPYSFKIGGIWYGFSVRIPVGTIYFMFYAMSASSSVVSYVQAPAIPCVPVNPLQGYCGGITWANSVPEVPSSLLQGFWSQLTSNIVAGYCGMTEYVNFTCSLAYAQCDANGFVVPLCNSACNAFSSCPQTCLSYLTGYYAITTPPILPTTFPTSNTSCNVYQLPVVVSSSSTGKGGAINTVQHLSLELSMLLVATLSILYKNL